MKIINENLLIKKLIKTVRMTCCDLRFALYNETKVYQCVSQTRHLGYSKHLLTEMSLYV